MAQVTLPYTLTAGTPENVNNLMSNLTALRDGVNTIDTAQLAASSVTAAKLATDAVETAKIKDANVTAAKLAQGAKGLVYLGSASPSAASTVSFNDVFTSSYTNYRVVYSLEIAAGVTGGAGLMLRFRTSGTDNSNSNYNWSRLYVSDVNGSASNGGGSNGQVSALNTGVLAGVRNIGSFEIGSPKLAEFTALAGQGQSAWESGFVNPTSWINFGSFNVATQFDGFTIYPASSTITGYVSVYGYSE